MGSGARIPCGRVMESVAGWSPHLRLQGTVARAFPLLRLSTLFGGRAAGSLRDSVRPGDGAASGAPGPAYTSYFDLLPPGLAGDEPVSLSLGGRLEALLWVPGYPPHFLDRLVLGGHKHGLPGFAPGTLGAADGLIAVGNDVVATTLARLTFPIWLPRWVAQALSLPATVLLPEPPAAAAPDAGLLQQSLAWVKTQSYEAAQSLQAMGWRIVTARSPFRAGLWAAAGTGAQLPWTQHQDTPPEWLRDHQEGYTAFLRGPVGHGPCRWKIL